MQLYDFAEVSQNLAVDTDLKILLLNHQNSYAGRSKWLLECQEIACHTIIFQQNCFQIYIQLNFKYSSKSVLSVTIN